MISLLRDNHEIFDIVSIDMEIQYHIRINWASVKGNICMELQHGGETKPFFGNNNRTHIYYPIKLYLNSHHKHILNGDSPKVGYFQEVFPVGVLMK